jgi:cupin 2 domain-containing protein
VLKGEAKLIFEDEAAPRDLQAGDFVDIPPHCRHRVEWTDPEVPTVWLAVFYG